MADRVTRAQVEEELRHRVRDLFDSPISVLEAGGGARFGFDVPQDSAITLVDASPEQVARNTYATRKILGDLETVDLGENVFDLVIFRDVLEHLSHPEAALDRAVGAARGRGVMVIGGPIVSSARGLVTKLTPHLLHVLFFRHALGWRNAGKPGYAPFPTFLRWSTHPDRLRDYLQRKGFEVIYYRTFESNHAAQLQQKSKLLFGAYLAASWLLRTVSLGRLGQLESDYRLIARQGEAM